MPALSKAFHYRFFMPRRSPATPPGKPNGLASSVFARHYLRNLGWFLFLQVLRCFTSLSLASVTYGFSNRYMDITPCGLPHSDISGSKLVCSSPKLIAAYRVLLRLLVPRHPSCALSSLTTKKQSLKNCLPVSQHKLLTFADIYISLNIILFSCRIFFNCQSSTAIRCIFMHLSLHFPSISQGKSFKYASPWQIIGGRTWIWTKDLVLIRDAL